MVSEKEKLVWMGLRARTQTVSEIERAIELLKENIGEFSLFQSDLDDENISSYSDFKTYLKDKAGFNQQEADNFVERIKNNFTDDDNSGSTYDEFEDFVENDAGSYSDMKSRFKTVSLFGSRLEDGVGQNMSGIRHFEQKGRTKEGQTAEAGAIEIFGKNVYVSQTGNPKTKTGSGSTGDDTSISWDMQGSDASQNVADIGETVTISADATNNGDYTEFVSGSLIEDGEVIKTKSKEIQAGETVTYNFEVTKDVYDCFDYKISKSTPLQVCWTIDNLLV